MPVADPGIKQLSFARYQAAYAGLLQRDERCVPVVSPRIGNVAPVGGRRFRIGTNVPKLDEGMKLRCILDALQSMNRDPGMFCCRTATGSL
jgi:hypothetical protein